MPVTEPEKGASEPQKGDLHDLKVNYLWALRLAWSVCPRLVTARAGVHLVQSLIPALVLLNTRQIIVAIYDALTAVDKLPGKTGDLDEAMLWLLTLPALAVIDAMCGFVGGYLGARLGEELNLKINIQILEQASRLDLAFFEDPQQQDLLARAQRNAAQHCARLMNSLLHMANVLLQTGAFVVIVLLIEPWTAPALVALGIPYLLFQWRMSKTQYWIEHNRTTRRRWSRYFTTRLTKHAFVPEVKLLDLAPLLINKFKGLLERFRDENMWLQRRRLVGNVIFGVLATVMIYGLFTRVIFRAVEGGDAAPELGTVVIFLPALAKVYDMMNQLVRIASGTMHTTMMISNLRELTLAQPAAPDNGQITPATAHGEIVFEHVSFTYPASGKHHEPVLRDVSFSIGAGEKVALVGANGAGKTTIVKLLGRLYKPDAGRILFDGHDVADLSRTYLNQQISFVLQAFGRYEATAGENIAYGDWRRLMDDPDELRRIAQDAGVDQMIEQFPDGYDTVLGRMFGDFTLSGGQWQQLALARALARNPKLLVLDEPTSNLDARAEYELFEQSRRLARDRTTIIISHRFSTVRMADRIIVLEQGQVVEQGTHEQLQSARGHYASLYELHTRSLTD